MSQISIPYFDNVNDYVNSLPYNEPLKEFNGYIYENPFYSRYGERPEIVYKRLFKEDHYFNLTDEELKLLRSTIQYIPVFLDDAFNRIDNFFKECGFENYKREGKPGDLIHSYYRRNNISLYLSNLTTPQDYIPNTINFEIAQIKTYSSGKKRRYSHSSVHFEDLDNLGELTKKNFEDKLKLYINEIQ